MMVLSWSTNLKSAMVWYTVSVPFTSRAPRIGRGTSFFSMQAAGNKITASSTGDRYENNARGIVFVLIIFAEFLIGTDADHDEDGDCQQAGEAPEHAQRIF